MNPKKIAAYRTLLNVSKNSTLKELKSIYRDMMKTSHPDAIADPDERELAEERCKTYIEAYHFLVSIAPETQNKNKEVYTKTTSTVNIKEFYMDNGVLYISFVDGSQFEYFSVPKVTYIKMVNSESPSRFARRHIYNEFLYRSASKLIASP